MKIKLELQGSEYEIERDSFAYMARSFRPGKTKTGKDKTATVLLGYFKDLGGAVNKILEEHLADTDETVTLKGYVARYEQLSKEIRGILDDVEF